MRPAGPAGRRKIDDDDLYFKALSLSSARSLFLLSLQSQLVACVRELERQIGADQKQPELR